MQGKISLPAPEFYRLVRQYGRDNPLLEDEVKRRARELKQQSAIDRPGTEFYWVAMPAHHWTHCKKYFTAIWGQRAEKALKGPVALLYPVNCPRDTIHLCFCLEGNPINQDEFLIWLMTEHLADRADIMQALNQKGNLDAVEN